MVNEVIATAIIGTVGLIVTALINNWQRKINTKLVEVKEAINGKIDALIKVNRDQAAMEERIKHERDSIKSVIILDDDSEDLDLLGKIVDEMDPVKCYKYGDVLLFLSHLTNKKCIYIIDDNLGGHSGLSILDEIKKRNIHNFIILCTGSGDPVLFAKYVNVGVKRILEKGYKINKEKVKKFVMEGVEAISTVEIN